MWDPGKYRKGGIRVSTGEWSERVLERWDPGEYQPGKVGSGRVPGRWDPDEYREGRNLGKY